MSSMEFVKGEIIPLGVSVETFMKMEDSYDALEEFLDKYTKSKEYILVGGIVHKVIEYKELDPCGYVEVTKTKDGTIKFISLWYNGGGDLDECLSEAIKDEARKANS